MTAPGGLEGMVGYLYELGLLKRLPRAGWLVAGIDHPESVAEHSFRTAIIGYLLASIEGADPARTALLCLFHDTQESRIGDVPLVGKRYVVTAPNRQVTADQVAGFPEKIGRAVRALVDDYERQDSAEARLARDADKLECLIQAREYQAQGRDVQPWVESAAAALRSETARRFAGAFRQARPDQWWKSFAGQLRPQPGWEQTGR
jgi:putative hydrolase of HD superfamily